jgi:hypothetical protein
MASKRVRLPSFRVLRAPGRTPLVG